MEIKKAGYQYALKDFEGNGTQQLQFIEKKIPDSGPKGTLETVSDGTTNEEVLAVLIDRVKFLNGIAPCRENSIVITKLEEGLMWLNKRTADRVERGVEGTPNK